MDYTGIIIEESLLDAAVLQELNITATKIEPVTEAHKTPWIKQWTMHSVSIPTNKAAAVAQQLSEALDGHYWYADFKNDTTHLIIFPHKVFTIDRHKPDEYKAATAYGISLGIPDYQLDFSPHILSWERP